VARIIKSSNILITNPEETEALLTFLQPLVKDVVEDGGAEVAEDDDDFEAAQALIAALIHRSRPLAVQPSRCAPGVAPLRLCLLSASVSRSRTCLCLVLPYVSVPRGRGRYASWRHRGGCVWLCG
jgi:hypothetical protein